MNKVTEQILQAIETMVDDSTQRLKYDRTVAAEIYGLENADTGEYRVRYQGNLFLAYSADLETIYSAGDQVYIAIPEGDFSNRKTITGYVAGNSLSDIQLTELANTIIEISPNLSSIYNNEDYFPEAGIAVGIAKGTGREHKKDIFYRASLTTDAANDRFLLYSDEYEYIKIQASFLTTFHDTHMFGDYGLEVEFFTRDVDGNLDSVVYTLDHSSFNGDPYRLTTYSPQYIVLKVQKNYLKGLKRISLFEKDFNYDNQITTDDNPNVFCKDVEIKYVERRDLTDTSYYLTISPLDGNSFVTNGKTRLSLQGRLIYQGKDVLSTSKSANYVCTWYERDLSIIPGGSGYDKDVGFGWKKIEFPNNNYELEHNGATLVLTNPDSNTHLRYEQKYKLKVVYNKKVTTVAEIEAFNLRNGYASYSLEQTVDTISDDIKLSINPNSYTGVWYYSYPDGTYFVFNNGAKASSILIRDLLIYSSATFYCAVYSGNNYLGTLEHTVFNTDSEEDLVIEYDGQESYKYDANGDIPYEDTERDRTLSIRLKWKEGIGAAYKIEWLMRGQGTDEYIAIPSDSTNNQIAYNNRFDPYNSMLQKVWLDKANNILHYNIKQKFKSEYTNNYLIIKVTTLDKEPYIIQKEILFLKDGDQGTNGTSYIAAIRPYTTSGSSIIKQGGFSALQYNGGWQGDLDLFCFVYKDGEQINSNSEYSINYTWTATNARIEGKQEHKGKGYSYARVSATGYGPSDTDHYVKIQVDIKNNTDGKENTIYTYYPLDVVCGDLNTSTIEMGIPSYIKYSASGVTPQTYRDEVYFISNKTKYSGSTYIEPLNKQVLDIKDSRLSPATHFTFEDATIGVLKCKTNNSSNYIVHSIIMYLDTYGNEAINGWDGTKLEIDPQNQEWLFAPQIGAGEKDSANRFSGVVMGKDNAQKEIGLYGYRQGLNTFGLMDTGTAFFGAPGSGGRIIIDGQTAAIYGGDSSVNERTGDPNRAENGMILFLADRSEAHRQFDGSEAGKQVDEATVAISIGKTTESYKKIGNHKQEHGVFEVNYNGDLIAHSATINGHLYAVDGKIGGNDDKNDDDGWTITTNLLYSSGKARDGDGYVALYSGDEDEYKAQAVEGIKIEDPGYYRIWAGGKDPKLPKTPFKVTSKGVVTMNQADITGYIYATGGQIGCTFNNENGKRIGGWLITSDQISSTWNDEQDKEGSKGAVYLNSGINSRNGQKADKDDRTYGDSTVGDRGYYRIWAGHPEAKKAPFAVTSNGSMYADNAIINGKIYAEEGRIGREIKRDADGQPIYDEDGKQINTSRGWIIKGDTITSDSGVVVKEQVPIKEKKLKETIEKIVGYNNEIVRYDREPYIVMKQIEQEDGTIMWDWVTEYREVPVYEDVPIIETEYVYEEVETTEEVIKTGSENKDYVGLYNDAKPVYITISKQNGQIQIPKGELKEDETIAEKPDDADYKNKKYADLGYVRFSAGHSSIDKPVSGTKFLITSKGYAYMKGAYIDGKINSEEGQIGGWILTTGRLYANLSNGRTMGLQSGYSNDGINVPGKFAIWVNGASNTATTLNIRNTKEDYYSGGSTSSYSIIDDDTISQNDAYFYVDKNGRLYCQNATINGTIQSKKGYIGGWVINDNTLYARSGNTYLNGQTGYIVCTHLEANESGSIGGWTIDRTILSGGGTTLNSDGTITCRKLIADTEGSIGGWEITPTTISKNNTELNSATGIITTDYFNTRTGYLGNLSKAPNVTSDIFGIYGNRSAAVVSGGPIVVKGTSAFIQGTGGGDVTLISGASGSGGEILIRGNSIWFQHVTANNQHGIYARFG